MRCLALCGGQASSPARPVHDRFGRLGLRCRPSRREQRWRRRDRCGQPAARHRLLRPAAGCLGQVGSGPACCIRRVPQAPRVLTFRSIPIRSIPRGPDRSLVDPISACRRKPRESCYAVPGRSRARATQLRIACAGNQPRPRGFRPAWSGGCCCASARRRPHRPRFHQGHQCRPAPHPRHDQAAAGRLAANPLAGDQA